MLSPSLLSSVWMLVTLHAHAQTPAAAPATAAAPDPALVEGIDLRQFSACQAILPAPPASTTAPASAPARRGAPPAPPAPDPLCAAVTPPLGCVAPARNAASTARRSLRVPTAEEQESPPPPAPPLPSHTAGLTHVFDWLKAMNTCRYQAGAALPRPEEPAKGEFETDASFVARKAQFSAQMAEREQRAAHIHDAIDPRLAEVRFVALLRADGIGEYDPDQGCFFPGAVARVELDDFKSRDTVYARSGSGETEKYRLVPRDEILRTDVTSTTIADIRLARNTPKTVLEVVSHPICVTPEVGRILREQRERNEIADYGVQAEIMLEFVLDDLEHPLWKVSGEFVYRGAGDLVEQPADPEAPRVPVVRTISVNPAAQAPKPDGQPVAGSGVPGPAGARQGGSGSGCATAAGEGPAALGALSGLLALVGRRRRRSAQ